jgi:hypothetical protein
MAMNNKRPLSPDNEGVPFSIVFKSHPLDKHIRLNVHGVIRYEEEWLVINFFPDIKKYNFGKNQHERIGIRQQQTVKIPYEDIDLVQLNIRLPPRHFFKKVFGSLKSLFYGEKPMQLIIKLNNLNSLKEVEYPEFVLNFEKGSCNLEIPWRDKLYSSFDEGGSKQSAMILMAQLEKHRPSVKTKINKYHSI